MCAYAPACAPAAVIELEPHLVLVEERIEHFSPERAHRIEGVGSRLVLEQDRELATQRLRLEIEQAAESAVGAMQQSLASLIALVAQPPEATPTLPADLAFVRIENAKSPV